MIQRRGLLAGLGALLAAPAIIRTPGLLMPVRPFREPLLAAADFGRDEGTLLFFSTPSGAENGWMWRAWLERARQDVEFVTGVKEEMLRISERDWNAVTKQAQESGAESILIDPLSTFL